MNLLNCKAVFQKSKFHFDKEVDFNLVRKAILLPKEISIKNNFVIYKKGEKTLSIERLDGEKNTEILNSLLGNKSVFYIASTFFTESEGSIVMNIDDNKNLHFIGFYIDKDGGYFEDAESYLSKFFCELEHIEKITPTEILFAPLIFDGVPLNMISSVKKMEKWITHKVIHSANTCGCDLLFLMNTDSYIKSIHVANNMVSKCMAPMLSLEEE